MHANPKSGTEATSQTSNDQDPTTAKRQRHPHTDIEVSS